MSPLELLPNTYRSFYGTFFSLTSAQKALIEPILEGRDVVLQAGTGLGKTEAILAPVTERLLTSCDPFTLLYIVPTKALALDMNRRIKPIYKQLGLKIGVRTGDGKTMRDATPDLLILTPESLDVLLGSQNQNNRHFLTKLRTIIIDEVHIFLHNERGRQLSLLRRRLQMQSKHPLQTLTLSATLFSLEEIASFFNLQKVFCYQQSATRKLEPCWVHLEDEERELIPFFNDLSLRWGCKKLLVFANSRRKCEMLFDLLSQDTFFSDAIFLHYSNLSTKERRQIESSFRDKKTAICIATSTLEMGIDIGDIDGIVLMGPPPSTMAFLQRIGRGNRRKQHVNFWGVCYGDDAEHQLLRFLALFELAKENKVEQLISSTYDSVHFQQILSCLYANRLVSQGFLNALFKTEELQAILDEMLAKQWLNFRPELGLFSGGWRYGAALKYQKIWSNFPPADEEYDVILDQEKIASLPFSTVNQLEIGDIVQLAGKIVKVLQIEEKKVYREVLVESSQLSPTKELLWYGLGSPTPFDVAQKIASLLSDDIEPEGLLTRTKRLLEAARSRIKQATPSSSAILVHRPEENCYRYETFLGTVGNLIMHRLIKNQFSPKIEGLSLSFDEMGIESNRWLPLEFLKLPDAANPFQDFVASHLSVLKQSFQWNSWLYCLPEKLQVKEIYSHLLDTRLLDKFKQYSNTEPLQPLPFVQREQSNVTTIELIPLKGKPWSIEEERQRWGFLSFASPPSHTEDTGRPLTASQIQGFVAQRLCPRWARFHHLRFTPQSHPQLHNDDQLVKLQRQEGVLFKTSVLEELKKNHQLHKAGLKVDLTTAINQVISTKKPLFLVEMTLEVQSASLARPLRGRPDLIYIKHQEGQICLEIWDIKNGDSLSYAQKWKVAFYAYLLESLLEKETFSLPVKVSNIGGFIYRSSDENQLYDRTHFLLMYFKKWIPRLITRWQANATQTEHSYSIENSCTTCRYFSYCYQETLFKDFTPPQHEEIVFLGEDSNDLPKNTKQWFFMSHNQNSTRWQCWEGKEVVSERLVDAKDYLNHKAYQEAVVSNLLSEWSSSVQQGKNPHLLFYDPSEWHLFQNAFHSTNLQSLWATHTCWTSIHSVLEKHFVWPFFGRLTAAQVARCLGLEKDESAKLPAKGIAPSLSLYHSSELPFECYRHIWNWCLTYVKSHRTVDYSSKNSPSVPLINHYLTLHRRECECRTHAILKLQKKPLEDRVNDFRAVGPLTFTSCEAAQRCYLFSFDPKAPIAKFRVGDFLKLSPVNSPDIQKGFSVRLEAYNPQLGTLALRPLSKRIRLTKSLTYALDESAIDRNGAKIEAVLKRLNDPYFRPQLIELLHGVVKSRSPQTTCASLQWVKGWYSSYASVAALNDVQQKALFLPFSEPIGLIEGPPGTGKTHLLVWTIIALWEHAKSSGRPIKVLVTAQTHHAIDQILKKIAITCQIAAIETPSLWKYGRYDSNQMATLAIHSLEQVKTLTQASSLIIGSTGYGIYQLLAETNFSQLFDWIIFDEASQILPSYALISLAFAKGNALFYGDTQQLPPVIAGDYTHTSLTTGSILETLMARYAPKYRLRLNQSYRMNKTICQFASDHWYQNELFSALPEDSQQLSLAHYPLFGDTLDGYLNPSQPITVVQLEHKGCSDSSTEEAVWVALAVKRLIEDYSISADEIAIISAHRLQNNTILAALKERLSPLSKLPRVDTVERMQGAEFDTVIFSAAASEQEAIHNRFLKDYRRFNVSLTRARKKFIFVASSLFFETFPMNEKELIAHQPFDDLLALYKLQ